MTPAQQFNHIIDSAADNNDFLTVSTFFSSIETKLTNLKVNILQQNETDITDTFHHIYEHSLHMPLAHRIYTLSFLTSVDNTPQYPNLLLELLISSNELSYENLFFIYYQIVSKNFTNSDIHDSHTDLLMSDLYRKIYEGFMNSVSPLPDFIKKGDRNKKLAVVFISQFLGLSHGPTKTVLDRCEVIKSKLGMTPFIINTAELLPLRGFMPFFSPALGSYDPSLLEKEFAEYHGDKFSFLQCENNMPNSDDISTIANVIHQLRPYCIFNIGGNSIASDICSNIIPTITISTVPSARCMTEGQFQVIGRAFNEDDLNWLEVTSRPRDHIIEALFTSSFRPQEGHITRKELGIPEDVFAGIIVGGRLDRELDDDFLSMLSKAMDKGIFIAFMGVFNNYEDTVSKYPIFRTHSKNLGFISDVMAAYECFDVYLNPKRNGGGTSVAEALSKGLPALTLAYGDVGLGAGNDFHVADYQEMLDRLLKYSSDSGLYSTMSEKALSRASLLTDSASSFVKILETAEKSSRF